MQVLWRSSDTGAEVRCSVCWQGFALYWDRQSESGQAEALERAVDALKGHRCTGKSEGTHPARGGGVSTWAGPMVIAGALLGHPADWKSRDRAADKTTARGKQAD